MQNGGRVLDNIICDILHCNKTHLTFQELCYDRYKFVVQVVIGEQRGEGVKYETHLNINKLKLRHTKNSILKWHII